MKNDTEMKDIPTQVLVCYQVFRGRVSEEDSVVNHQMTWMIATNAIFFGFFAGVKLNIEASSLVPH